jgi:hypothetical protein
MLAPIIEEQGFGAALAFVITGPGADRIDVAPVLLRLRVDVGITIDFEVEAWRILARSRLARPSRLMAPCTLVLVVCTGSCW